MRHWLFLVWLCFLGRGIFYATVLPLWEGYDEYAHFAYVQYLALYAELPTSGMRISREVEQSLRIVPVPWMLRQSCSPPCLVHDDYWKLSDVERAERRRQLRVLDPDPSGATEKLFLYEAQQPPLYYWLLSWPLGAAGSWSLAGRVLLLRWLSVAIASLVIPLGFLLAREVFRHETSALGVVALVAAMPEFLLDISRIGNESLAVVLFTLLVYGSLRDTWWQGLALGLGLLTKAYFLAAAPALLLVSLRRRKPHGALAVAFGAAVAGWWYWRNRVLTGSWAGLQVTAAARELSLADILRLVGQVDWRNALDSAFLSHIWFGNWSFLQVRSWMYHFFGYVVLAAILGLLVRAARREPSVFPLGAFYGCFLLGVAYHTLILYAVLHDSSAPGWYIYCLVVPEAILATLGLQAVAPERWVLAVGTVCFVALDLYATHFVMIPYYAGLIAHKTNGALEAFRGQGLATALLRLQENKPAWIGAPFLVGTWLLFLAATVGLLAIQARSVYNFDNRGGTNDARS